MLGTTNLAIAKVNFSSIQAIETSNQSQEGGFTATGTAKNGSFSPWGNS
jgi:hypothetical protein